MNEIQRINDDITLSNCGTKVMCAQICIYQMATIAHSLSVWISDILQIQRTKLGTTLIFKFLRFSLLCIQFEVSEFAHFAAAKYSFPWSIIILFVKCFLSDFHTRNDNCIDISVYVCWHFNLLRPRTRLKFIYFAIAIELSGGNEALHSEIIFFLVFIKQFFCFLQ